jgi:superfamily II DNA or RNA helicase
MGQLTLFHQAGTLVLVGASESERGAIPPQFQWKHAHWRCEAYRYHEILPWLRRKKVHDSVPQWEGDLPLTIQDGRQLHDYQTAALRAWQKAGSRGGLLLPTGSGKTVVAIHAIYRSRCSALIVVPTIDLLHTWFIKLSHAYGGGIGVYYNAEKIIKPITVVTYHSASDLLSEHGQKFRLICFDECHHLPSPSWSEVAVMAVAPWRLGLTATYPDEQDSAYSRLQDLVGPLVYSQRIDDLTGEYLAEYRTSRVRIDLTEEERRQYEANHAECMDYVERKQLREKHGAAWLGHLRHLAAYDNEARGALRARRRNQRLLASAQGKLSKLDDLLEEYISAGELILIFTEDNRTAYRISLRYLIPCISHFTTAEERKYILDQFRRGGAYRCLVASRVLDEGVDLVESKIAIVLGGSGSARQQKQRLGRILRKVENQQAELIEVIARRTTEEGKSQRRQVRE